MNKILVVTKSGHVITEQSKQNYINLLLPHPLSVQFNSIQSPCPAPHVCSIEQTQSLSYKLKSLPHLAHQLLLPLVRHSDVLDQSREMRWPISGQYKCVPGLAQEVDKVSVVSRGNVRQSGVSCVHIRRNSRLKELSQWRPFVAQLLHVAH